VEGRPINQIFPYPDDLKFKSSMSLFASVTPDNQVFTDALQKYFGGEFDGNTLGRLWNSIFSCLPFLFTGSKDDGSKDNGWSWSGQCARQHTASNPCGRKRIQQSCYWRPCQRSQYECGEQAYKGTANYERWQRIDSVAQKDHPGGYAEQERSKVSKRKKVQAGYDELSHNKGKVTNIGGIRR
jgi:hypothetical protein